MKRHSTPFACALVVAFGLALAAPAQATITAKLYAGTACGGATSAQFVNDGVTPTTVSLCITTQTADEGLCTFTFVPIGLTAADSGILQITSRTFIPAQWSETNGDGSILPFTIPAAAFSGSDLGSGNAVFNSTPLPVGENLISTFNIVVPPTATASTYNITLDTTPPALSSGSAGPDGLCISTPDFDDVVIDLPTAPTFTLVAPITASGGVVSRATHGAAGTFDLLVNTNAAVISSAITVEPRAAEAGNIHRLVFNLSSPVTSVGGVQLSGKSGSILATGTASAPVINGNTVTVTLTNVPDRKRLLVTLTNINGVAGANVTAAIAYLRGDVTQDLFVNGLDRALTAVKSPSAVNSSNFLFNVAVTGFINGLDAALVGANSPNSVE